MSPQMAKWLVAALCGAVIFYFASHHVSLYDLRDAMRETIAG